MPDDVEQLAQRAHKAWPRDLSFPDVLSLFDGWRKWGPRMPRTELELAWLAGLRTADEALYLEVMALVPLEGSNPPSEWGPE